MWVQVESLEQLVHDTRVKAVCQDEVERAGVVDLVSKDEVDGICKPYVHGDFIRDCGHINISSEYLNFSIVD